MQISTDVSWESYHWMAGVSPGMTPNVRRLFPPHVRLSAKNARNSSALSCSPMPPYTSGR